MLRWGWRLPLYLLPASTGEGIQLAFQRRHERYAAAARPIWLKGILPGKCPKSESILCTYSCFWREKNPSCLPVCHLRSADRNPVCSNGVHSIFESTQSSEPLAYLSPISCKIPRPSGIAGSVIEKCLRCTSEEDFVECMRSTCANIHTGLISCSAVGTLLLTGGRHPSQNGSQSGPSGSALPNILSIYIGLWKIRICCCSC